MPIDSIDYFGISDTTNPFNNTSASKIVNNIYEIKTYGNTGISVVRTGLIPNFDNITTSVFQVINPSDGSIIATLTPQVFDVLGNQQPPPLNTCYIFNVNQYQSAIYINTSYTDNYLRISLSSNSCSVMGEWMNITHGSFLEYRDIGQSLEIPKGSWFPCDGTTLVNRFLYPKYYDFVQQNIGWDILSIDPVSGNPFTPNLKGLFRRNIGNYDSDRNSLELGMIQADTMQLLTGEFEMSYGVKGVFRNIRTKYNTNSGNVPSNDVSFNNSLVARTSNQNMPINTSVNVYVRVV